MIITCDDIKPGDVLKTVGNQDLYVTQVIAVGLQDCVRRFSADKADAIQIGFSNGSSVILPRSEELQAETAAGVRELRLHSVNAVVTDTSKP